MYGIANYEIGLSESAKRICSAIVIQAYKDYLSENSEAYWVSLDDLGVRMKIGKESEQGQAITKAMKDKKAPGSMFKILIDIALPHITAAQLCSMLHYAKDEGRREGQQQIRNGMLALLFPQGV